MTLSSATDKMFSQLPFHSRHHMPRPNTYLWLGPWRRCCLVLRRCWTQYTHNCRSPVHWHLVSSDCRTTERWRGPSLAWAELSPWSSVYAAAAHRVVGRRIATPPRLTPRPCCEAARRTPSPTLQSTLLMIVIVVIMILISIIWTLVLTFLFNAQVLLRYKT